MPSRLLQSIVSLIRSWLTIDRIRAGRSLRQLSSLDPGETLFVRGELAVVEDRTITRSCDSSLLTIECDTESGPAILRVCCGSTGRESQLTWERASINRSIQLDEIVVPTQRK